VRDTQFDIFESAHRLISIEFVTFFAIYLILQGLVLNAFTIESNHKNNTSHPLMFVFQHRSSLIIKGLIIMIDDLKQFLSLTPSLNYFKLIGTGKFFNRKRWQKFASTEQIGIFLHQKTKFSTRYSRYRIYHCTKFCTTF